MFSKRYKSTEVNELKTRCTQLFFFQQCSLSGSVVFTGGDPQLE